MARGSAVLADSSSHFGRPLPRMLMRVHDLVSSEVVLLMRIRQLQVLCSPWVFDVAGALSKDDITIALQSFLGRKS